MNTGDAATDQPETARAWAADISSRRREILVGITNTTTTTPAAASPFDNYVATGAEILAPHPPGPGYRSNRSGLSWAVSHDEHSLSGDSTKPLSINSYNHFPKAAVDGHTAEGSSEEDQTKAAAVAAAAATAALLGDLFPDDPVRPSGTVDIAETPESSLEPPRPITRGITRGTDAPSRKEIRDEKDAACKAGMQ